MCKVPACTAKYASFAARPSNSSYAEARHGHFRLQRRKILDCSRLLLKISNYPQAREHNGKHSFDEVYVYHIEYGIPNEIVAVFGTQYTSAEFRKRCKDCGINLTFSSPHHHQANSVAERSVGTIKQLWKKADESGQCRGTAVLMYRSTPLDGTMPSPYELLFNRKPNTFLPTAGKALNPRHVDYEDHLVQNQQRQQDQAKSYDRRHGAIYLELHPSEPECLQHYQQSMGARLRCAADAAKDVHCQQERSRALSNQRAHQAEECSNAEGHQRKYRVINQ